MSDKNLVTQRFQRIEERKKEIGTKHRRKLKKYSNNFNKIFYFFFLSYRKDILTFCGSNVDVLFDINGVDCKEGFRLYEDGHFKNEPIVSRHSNILRALIISKKSWGLFVQEWTDGICEWCFTKEELLGQFEEIEIPESFIKDFDNVLERKKIKRNLKFLEK